MHNTPMGLLGMFGRARAPAAFLEGRVGFAVGDIHGRADLLALMLDDLESLAAAETRAAGAPIVVFLGDYIDRGRGSARVIELLLEGRPHGYERRFLRGNHEQAMLDYLEAPAAYRAWLLHGGVETMLSYGVAPPSLALARDGELIAAAEALKTKLPPEHLAFLNGLERYVELGGYAFVHAGIDPGRPLDRQRDVDLYWSRKRFLNSKRRFSHRVVHGHTPAEQPYADSRRIGLDTGAYATGVLTAARFEGAEIGFHFASIGAQPEF